MAAFVPNRISIVVPVYNAGAYLDASLNSLKGQTWGGIEVILVDDGSTDDSRRVCEAFAAEDPRFRVLSKPNGGPGSARNLGLGQITGEFFGFMDADDTIDADYFEALLTALQRADADIAVCDFSKGEGREASWGEGTFEGSDIMREFAEGGFFNRTVNKLYRSDRFGLLRFPEGRDYVEDAPWTAQALARAERVTRIPRAGYHYRMLENSLTHRRAKPARRMCGYYRNVLERDEIILCRLAPADTRAARKIACEALDIFHNMFESWYDLTLFDAYACARSFAARQDKLLRSCADSSDIELLDRIRVEANYRAVARFQRLRVLLSPAAPLKRKARLLYRLKNRVTGADRE